MAITLDGNNTGTVGVVNSATAVASTSGTSINFTGIPSGVKRITVMFQGVSTNGTSIIQIQIGSSSFTTSGYTGTGGIIANANTTSTATLTTGFPVSISVGAANNYTGIATINLLNPASYIWVYQSTFSRTDTAIIQINTSTVTLAGILDRVRITTVNGTDTFDAGSINILYE